MNTSGSNISKLALALSFALLLSSNTNVGASGEKDELSAKKQLDRGNTVVSTEQKSNGHRWVKAKILIKASAHVVWDTVHEERQHDPDLEYSKILNHADNNATLEQKFSLIPIIGTAVCVMKNREVPNERIDYNMVSSDRFKAMEGSWVLTPGSDQNSTYLELSSYLDTGLPITRPLVEGVTARKLQRRVTNVKNMAEAMQHRVAQGATIK